MIQKIRPLNTGFFKLDCGAMFGVVPKSLWSRTNPADERNLCTWALRCLLIETPDRKIIIDTGIGDKQSDKFFSHYDLHGDLGLDKAMSKIQLSPNDITDVVLTHLHFDHVGGAVKKDGTLYFPNATYWSHSSHWNWAMNPNAREKASFLKENIVPIQESGQLKFVNEGHDLPFEFDYADGHTEKQIIAWFNFQDKWFTYAADLLPSTGHIPQPYVMGYDVRPLITMEEKISYFEKVLDRDATIILEHDSLNEACKLQRTEKGIRLDQAFSLSEI